MKKQLLMFLVVAGFAHEANAMNNSEKDFTKDFFDNLDAEFNPNKDSLLLKAGLLTQERDELKKQTQLKQISFDIRNMNMNMHRNEPTSILNLLTSFVNLFESASMVNDTSKLISLQDEIGSITKEVLSDSKLHASIQDLKKEYSVKPYIEKVKTNDDFIKKVNDIDNNAHHEALLSLEVTKKVMEYNLSNVGWVQWIWNNKVYSNYKKSINDLNDEIASFKDQDRIVYEEKSISFSF